MHMNGMESGWGIGLMGWSMWIVWIILAIAFFWIIKAFVNISQSSEFDKSAIDILNERYAKGEIDKDEYLAKKRAIMK